MSFEQIVKPGTVDALAMIVADFYEDYNAPMFQLETFMNESELVDLVITELQRREVVKAKANLDRLINHSDDPAELVKDISSFVHGLDGEGINE